LWDGHTAERIVQDLLDNKAELTIQ
jgi:hypothetical protein